MMNIGYKIKKAREIKGFTQEYIADEINVSQKTYSLIENNQTKLDIVRLQKIVQILEIDIYDLLTFDEKNIFNNTFNKKVEKNQNYVNIENSFEEEKTALLKHITHLENENTFLRKQLEKLI